MENTAENPITPAVVDPIIEQEFDLTGFKKHSRKEVSLLRPYIPGEDLTGIGISIKDIPSLGGMIAVNPKNIKDQWYVAKADFEENFEEEVASSMKKSLGSTDINGAKKNVRDIVVFGNGDAFKLICKASSKTEGWMKSTKAMPIHGLGCVVQVTTQQGSNIAEALTFIPGAKIHEIFSTEEGKEDLVISRSLVS